MNTPPAPPLAPSPALPPAVPPRRSRAGGLLLSLLLLLIVAAAGFFGWRYWQQQQAQSTALAEQQRQALDASVASLRIAQRAQAKRLQQAEATNRVLRDELLGIGQQRLQLADDLDGARRALALAAPLLGGIDDPAYFNLRQTLAQEQAALDALGIDPQIRANALLDALAKALQDMPTVAVQIPDQQSPWYERLMDKIVRVQPTAGAGMHERADREAAVAAMQVELSLARVAAERRDDVGMATALDRIDAWLEKLQPSRLSADRKRIGELKATPLQVDTPLSGSTLQQLRALRGQ